MADSNNYSSDGGSGSEDWYYIEKGERKGPVGAKALQSMFESGAIDENTKVWTKSFGNDWKAINQVSELRDEEQPPLAPASEIPNLWLYLLISVPVVMGVVEAILLENSILGGGPSTLMLYFIPNTICGILDQKAVERSGRKDTVKGLLLWILLLIPVYVFLRSKRTGLGLWPGFAWIGAVVMGVLVSQALPSNVYLGSGIPACDSKITMSQIEEIYPSIPINLLNATVIDVTDVLETGYSREGGVRECTAIVRNSSGADTPIEYSISERGDQFYFEVGLAGF